jgi:hypothetical protein
MALGALVLAVALVYVVREVSALVSRAAST